MIVLDHIYLQSHIFNYLSKCCLANHIISHILNIIYFETNGVYIFLKNKYLKNVKDGGRYFGSESKSLLLDHFL